MVGAVGKSKFIQGSWIKEGAVVVNAGYHPGNVGDIDLETVIPRSSAYTPVPCGPNGNYHADHSDRGVLL